MSHFLLTSVVSLRSVWKGFNFSTLKDLLPSVFSCFKQGWSAFICITEHYRFQLFVSYSFSVLCVCLGWHGWSHRMSWRTSRDLLAQDRVPGSVSLGSPRGCPNGNVSYSFFPFLPRSWDTTKADHCLLCHQSIWLMPGSDGGKPPFPC